MSKTSAATSNVAAQVAKPQEPHSGPWWKYGHMWMVLGGPFVVVVAAISTVVIATRGADPVIDSQTYRQSIAAHKTLDNPDKSMAPAQSLRNHAATPDADLPSLQPK